MEIVYSRRDILRRRALVHEALGAQPGDRVLDAGCGPGFYVKETLERVGPEGSVVGVDASDQVGIEPDLGGSEVSGVERGVVAVPDPHDLMPRGVTGAHLYFYAGQHLIVTVE